MYTTYCCGMIAMKREVAAERQVFRGANVKRAGYKRLRKLTTSHCTDNMVYVEDNLLTATWKRRVR
ncbi:hypothetical protein [Kineothrix sedimenti]|uniref:Uncharacterized protein n=1 Tax=Kineothrix sedimenti TaxID=3123317 RepID=A0ABZ3F0L4_9FIRM